MTHFHEAATMDGPDAPPYVCDHHGFPVRFASVVDAMRHEVEFHLEGVPCPYEMGADAERFAADFVAGWGFAELDRDLLRVAFSVYLDRKYPRRAGPGGT